VYFRPRPAEPMSHNGLKRPSMSQVRHRSRGRILTARLVGEAFPLARCFNAVHLFPLCQGPSGAFSAPVAVALHIVTASCLMICIATCSCR
jgi:hypothetical protein